MRVCVYRGGVILWGKRLLREDGQEDGGHCASNMHLLLGILCFFQFFPLYLLHSFLLVTR